MTAKTMSVILAFAVFAALLFLPLSFNLSAPGASNPNVSTYDRALTAHMPLVVNVSSPT